MKTKDRILEQALELFNAQGTHAVTTNHIAERLGMSPGNLYYHFENKEEIVRGLFERLAEAWDVAFTLPPEHQPGLDDLERLLQRNFEVLWQYRFFYREQVALMQRDAELLGRYRAVRKRGFAGFRELFGAFAAGGVLRTASPGEVDRLAQLSWLVSDFWLTSLELDGCPVEPEHMERGVALLRQVLKPYVKETV